MRVLVTGTGYLSTALTEALARDPDVTGVTTVGRRPHARPVASLVRFVQRDLNEGVDDLLSGPSGPIDVAIHTAWVVDPWHDRAAQRRSSVDATKRFIEACERAQVRQLLFVSSDSIYGAHPDHDGRSLSESEPPKAWHHYQYSREKIEAERMFEELAARRPDMLVQIARPVTIWGPRVSNFISRMMTNPVIFTALGHDPLIQVIHEEDAAAALLAIVHSRARGVVNLAGPGDMRLSAVCRRIGRPRLPLPLPLLVLGAEIAWRARLGFVTHAPGEFVYFFAHPPHVDIARLRDEIGFRPRHDFEGALTSWLRARRGRRSMEDLEPFFARYAERYLASDIDAVSAMYEAPMLALREGRVIHLADRTAVRAHLSDVMAAYARSGATRADIASLDVVSLGRSSLFATVRWQVRDAIGGLLKEFRTTYHLARVTEEWRILSYTNHDD